MGCQHGPQPFSSFRWVTRPRSKATDIVIVGLLFKTRIYSNTKVPYHAKFMRTGTRL